MKYMGSITNDYDLVNKKYVDGKSFRIIATYQSGTDEWTLDKTFSEISAAYNSGAFVYIQVGEDYPSKIYPATAYGDEQGEGYIKFEGWDSSFYLKVWQVYEDNTVYFGYDSFASATHSHGYITDDGDITSSATIASGDRLVINDESSSRIINSSITFGTSTTQFLANNGTWQTPAGGSSYTATSPISISNNVISHSDSGIYSGYYTKLVVDDKGHATSGAFEYSLYSSDNLDQRSYEDIGQDFYNSTPPLISYNGQIYNFDWDDSPESEMHFSRFGYDYSGVPTLYSFYVEDGVSGIQSYSTTRLARYSEISDTKVTQTVRSNSADYPVLLAPSGQTATTTTTANFATSLKYNPGTNTLTAGTFNGNATSATSATNATNAVNAKALNDVSTTNPTTASTYFPIWTGNIGSGTAYTPRGNDGLRYMTLEGTTSAQGYGCLILGNSTASGTAGNKYGAIRIYASNSYYTELRSAAVTANRTLNLPLITATGYLLGKSSTSAIGASNQLVYFSASGVASAGIKISGGTADPSGGSSGDIYIKIPS